MALVPAGSIAFLSEGLNLQSYPFISFSLLILGIVLLARPLQLVATRHPHPTKQMLDDLSRHWPWLLSSAFIALALAQTLAAAAWIKQSIPAVNPFFADPVLIRMDEVLGIAPWQITHALFGAYTRQIDLAYGLWHFAQIGFCMWLVLTPRRAFQIRAVLAYQLSWLLLGGLAAMAMSSVGPTFMAEFYGSDHFAPLMEHLPADLYTMQARDYLLATKGTAALGGGISAMPSLHVGIALLIALCIRDQFPRFQAIAWAYVAIIYVGSIHLGWHYASDGIFSAVAVTAIWMATGAMVNGTRVRQMYSPETVARTG